MNFCLLLSFIALSLGPSSVVLAQSHGDQVKTVTPTTKLPCVDAPFQLRASHYQPGFLYGVCPYKETDEAALKSGIQYDRFLWIDTAKTSLVIKTWNLDKSRPAGWNYRDMVEVGPGLFAQHYSPISFVSGLGDKKPEEGIALFDYEKFNEKLFPYPELMLSKEEIRRYPKFPVSQGLRPSSGKSIVNLPEWSAFLVATFNGKMTKTGFESEPSTILQYRINPQTKSPVLHKHRITAPYLYQAVLGGSDGSKEMVLHYQNKLDADTSYVGAMSPYTLFFQQSPVKVAKNLVLSSEISSMTSLLGPEGIVAFDGAVVDETGLIVEKVVISLFSGNNNAFYGAHYLTWGPSFLEKLDLTNFVVGEMVGEEIDVESLDLYVGGGSLLGGSSLPFVKVLNLPTPYSKTKDMNTAGMIFARIPSPACKEVSPHEPTFEYIEKTYAELKLKAEQEGGEVIPLHYFFCDYPIQAMVTFEKNLYFARGPWLYRVENPSFFP